MKKIKTFDIVPIKFEKDMMDLEYERFLSLYSGFSDKGITLTDFLLYKIILELERKR